MLIPSAAGSANLRQRGAVASILLLCSLVTILRHGRVAAPRVMEMTESQSAMVTLAEAATKDGATRNVIGAAGWIASQAEEEGKPAEEVAAVFETAIDAGKVLMDRANELSMFWKDNKLPVAQATAARAAGSAVMGCMPHDEAVEAGLAMAKLAEDFFNMQQKFEKDMDGTGAARFRSSAMTAIADQVGIDALRHGADTATAAQAAKVAALAIALAQINGYDEMAAGNAAGEAAYSGRASNHSTLPNQLAKEAGLMASAVLAKYKDSIPTPACTCANYAAAEAGKQAARALAAGAPLSNQTKKNMVGVALSTANLVDNQPCSLVEEKTVCHSAYTVALKLAVSFGPYPMEADASSHLAEMGAVAAETVKALADTALSRPSKEAAGIAAGLARAKNEPDVQGEVNAAAEIKATEIKNECGGTVQSRGGTLVEQASASKCLVDNPIVLVGRAGDYASWPCVVPHLSLPFGLGRR